MDENLIGQITTWVVSSNGEKLNAILDSDGTVRLFTPYQITYYKYNIKKSGWEIIDYKELKA